MRIFFATTNCLIVHQIHITLFFAYLITPIKALSSSSPSSISSLKLYIIKQFSSHFAARCHYILHSIAILFQVFHPSITVLLDKCYLSYESVLWLLDSSPLRPLPLRYDRNQDLWLYCLNLWSHLPTHPLQTVQFNLSFFDRPTLDCTEIYMHFYPSHNSSFSQILHCQLSP